MDATHGSAASILAVEYLDSYPEIQRLWEERSNLFVLRLKGDGMVDPQVDGGDEGIVRAQLWVEHGDFGGAGIDEEMTGKTSLHRRTDLWLTPEAQQQGSPPNQLRSQPRVCIVSNVIGMATWLEPEKRLGRLPAWHVGPRKPPLGGTDSRPAWIKPEGAVVVVDARGDPSEASCRRSQAYERRKYCGRF
jgi:hypothetical protein